MRIEFRVTKPKFNFTIVPNRIIRDARLSLKAKALYIHLLSLPDDASATLRSLSACHVDGKDSITRASEELKSAGYLQVTSGQSQYGKFWSVWTLLDPETGPENKTSLSQNPGPENETSLSQNPGPENETHIKTLDQRLEDQRKPTQGVDDLVAAWNAMAENVKGIAPVHRLAGERLRLAQARMKDAYFVEHFAEAVQQVPKEAWRVGGGSKRAWFANFGWFVKPDTLDKLIGEIEAGSPKAGRRDRSMVRRPETGQVAHSEQEADCTAAPAAEDVWT